MFRKITLLLLLSLASSMNSTFAAELDPEVFIPEPTLGEKPNTRLVIDQFLAPTSSSTNLCTSATACKDLYELDVAPPRLRSQVTLPVITEAFVQGSRTLNLRLSAPLEDLDSVVLVLRHLTIGHPGDEDVVEMRLPLAPSIYLDPGGRNAIVYRGLRRRKEPPSKEGVKVTVKNAENGRNVPVSVKEIVQYAVAENKEGHLAWRIVLDRSLPRGKKYVATVEGLDGTIVKDLIELDAFPEGRDDANFYAKGEKVFDQLGDDQGSVDFKISQAFFLPLEAQEVWYLLEGTVGSKSLGLSQTGTASVGYRWWLNPEWAISLAPSFKTDKDFHNRDLGADLILEGQPSAWYHTLEAKRAREPERADKIKLGWWLQPKFTIEAGKHLASSAEEVEGETFSRAVAGFNLLLETDEIFTLFDTLSLTIDVAARYLADDEVTIDEEEVQKIEDGYKPYLRAELAYGFGPVALSVVHENGKLPPAFKTARATTVGVTFKF